MATAVRDATHTLDGILDNQTVLPIEEHSTDTHGYSDIIFGLFRLLGYRYARGGPTPAAPDSDASPEPTTGRLTRLPADPNAVRRPAPRRRQPAAAPHHCQPTDPGAAQPHPPPRLARQALQQVGRAAKTVHLLDYRDDQPFRHRILTQLNRGEGRHGLARDVCHGWRGELRQRHRQGQEEQLGALGVILNTIVLYNTIYTQRALDHLKATGVEIADGDIERLSLLATDHITVTGCYRIALPERLHDKRAYRPLTAAADARAA